MDQLLEYSSKNSYLNLTIQDINKLKPSIKIIRRISISDRGEGEIYEAKLFNREVILKTSPYLDNLYYEYNVGLKINTILDQTDTFIETFGMFLLDQHDYSNLFDFNETPITQFSDSDESISSPDNQQYEFSDDNQEYEQQNDNQEYELTEDQATNNNHQEYESNNNEQKLSSSQESTEEESTYIGILILEKVPGLTIYDILPLPSENDGSQKPLYIFTEDQTLDILSQIAKALDIAQQQIEFTHYDLHPGNVMIITEKNRFKVKIIDYGFSHVALDYEEIFLDKLLCIPKTTIIDCGVIPAIFDPDNDILNILQIIDIIAYYVSRFEFNKNYAKLKPLYTLMYELFKNDKLGASEVDWPFLSDSAVTSLPLYIYYYNPPNSATSTQEAQKILDHKPLNTKGLSDLLSQVKYYNVQHRPFLTLPKILALLGL